MAGQNPGPTVVVDASKSLFRLIYLICTQACDIKIVYIKRDLKGNISSFIKSRDGFLKGVVNYKLNHFFMPLFLRQNQLSFYYLSYKALCTHPESELTRLGAYLGLDLSYDRVIDNIRKRTFHVFTGSTSRSQFKDFKGIRYDRSWEKRLTRIQKGILDCITTRSER
jgi:hypothetical protein